jgi:hypothetical protein
VNVLSLSVDRRASYLGASSIKAALMVMLKVHPGLREVLSTPSNTMAMASNSVIQQKLVQTKVNQRISWSWKGQTLVNAYFKRVHVFVPMLDEGAFRTDFPEGHRLDSPWLSLLNMVFAMESIVAMKSDKYNHINYYNRAMEHMPMNIFGSSHIETVQSLVSLEDFIFTISTGRTWLMLSLAQPSEWLALWGLIEKASLLVELVLSRHLGYNHYGTTIFWAMGASDQHSTS